MKTANTPAETVGHSRHTSLGGKAASLVWLREHKFDTPYFRVFPSSSWRQAVAANEQLERAFTLLAAADDDFAIQTIAADIRDHISTMQLPPDVCSDVEREFQSGRLGPYVAVRSSALSEDGLNSSSAGQYETVLGASSPDEVLRAISAVLASYYGMRAISYRRARGISAGRLEMSVIIQSLIDARISGIAFSRDPMDAKADVCLIESTWGLGALIVSGQVEPDFFRILPAEHCILEQRVGSKRVGEFLDNVTGKIAQVAVSDSQTTVYALEPQDVWPLVSLVRDAEKKRGVPIDVEWAATVENGEQKFHLLQVRPITAIANTTAKSRDLT